jgi:hypothetical protein
MNETKTKMLHSWMALEHARLHLVAEWPESALKQTLLKAIRSSIQSLMINQDVASFACVMCQAAHTLVVLPYSPPWRRVISYRGIAA